MANVFDAWSRSVFFPSPSQLAKEAELIAIRIRLAPTRVLTVQFLRLKCHGKGFICTKPHRRFHSFIADKTVFLSSLTWILFSQFDTVWVCVHDNQQLGLVLLMT